MNTCVMIEFASSYTGHEEITDDQQDQAELSYNLADDCEMCYGRSSIAENNIGLFQVLWLLSMLHIPPR